MEFNVYHIPIFSPRLTSFGKCYDVRFEVLQGNDYEEYELLGCNAV
jgi:hypothetical protein